MGKIRVRIPCCREFDVVEPAVWTAYWTPQSMLLRSDLHFGRRSAHIGVDLALELHEIVLEHRNELARGVVELGLVLPSLVRIEQVRLDARQLGWPSQAQLSIRAQLTAAQDPV